MAGEGGQRGAGKGANVAGREQSADSGRVRVCGHDLVLGHLHKPLYPPVADQPATSKAAVLDYYTRIAPVLLGHLAGRPLTVRRWPDGVDGPSFFGKSAPAGTPAWLPTVRLPSPGSRRGRDQIDYLLVEDLAGLLWVVNLAALELHTPMWRVEQGRPLPPDLLVVDLDPGPPATVVDSAAVALRVRERLGQLDPALADGLVAKTSGRKGLQLYARWRTGDSREFARELAEYLERECSDRVVARMTRALRAGKVLVDWSQNNPAKTTVSVYSLRAGPRPTVSTPVRWEELERVRRPEELSFGPGEVLDRVDRLGDLFAGLLPGGAG